MQSGLGRRRKYVLTAAGLGVLAAGAGALGVRAARASACPLSVTFPPARPMRIDGVTIVDPRDGSSTPGMSILLRNGRIAALAPVGTLPTDESVRVLDGAGRYAVPGYNNMHTHALQAERPALVMAAMLAEGVTGMRQMMGTDDLLGARAQGRLPLTPLAPQLLSMPGDLLLPFNCSSVDEAVDEIGRQQRRGADFIKLILVDREVFFAAVDAAHTRGMKIAGHLPPSVGIAEASASGFDSIEHLGTGANVWIACSSEAGLAEQTGSRTPFPSWVAHVPFADKIFAMVMQKRLINPAAFARPADIAVMRRALDAYDDERARRLASILAANRTWQTPTLVRLRTQYLADSAEYQQNPWLAKMSMRQLSQYREVTDRFRRLPPDMRATYRQAYEMSLTTVGLWNRHGVPMMTGTDGQGNSPGQTQQLEFRELAKAGLTPLEILSATTTSPAEYLDRSDRMGRIGEGMDADLLLLDADPLAAVENLASISVVVRAGHPATVDELTETIEHLAADTNADGNWRGIGRGHPCCGSRGALAVNR